jgi:adenosylcobinamide-GDP ribazoletransferase
MVAGIYALCAALLPPLLASSVAVGIGILLTGGFHEDGLGDTADAFGGGWTRDDRLRIMKDSSQGTFGVLAITLSVLVRVVALAALTPSVAVAVLPTAHALARATAMWLLALMPTASVDGLGARYASVTSRRRAAVGSATAMCLGAALNGLWVAAFVASCIAAVGSIGWVSTRKIEGVTGDVAGAAEQLSEMAILVVAVAIVTNGHSPALWW